MLKTKLPEARPQPPWPSKLSQSWKEQQRYARGQHESGPSPPRGPEPAKRRLMCRWGGSVKDVNEGAF